MNQTPFRMGLALAIMTLASATAAGGCSSIGFDDGGCADCGPCGIAGGPNQTDSLNFTGPGHDTGGTPAVDVVLARAGECVNDNGERHRLRWDGSSISEMLVANVANLDTTLVERDSTGSYKFYYTDLSVRTERDGSNAVNVTFSEDGNTATMRCSIDAAENAVMTCVEVTE